MDAENYDFKKKLDEKIANAPADVIPSDNADIFPPTDSLSPPPNRTSKRTGRPKGATKKEPVVIEKPVPVPDELEAKLWAEMFAGLANAFVKKDYRDKLKFTSEEFLAITRPGTVLKAYYMPNFGGIYVYWTQFLGGVIGVGASKFTIIKELMDDEKGQRPSTERGRNDGRAALRGDGVVDTIAGGGNVAGNTDGKGQPGDSFPVGREKNNPSVGDAGNGQIHQSQGVVEFTPPDFGL